MFKIKFVSLFSICVLLSCVSSALAHHGGVSAAFGPGAPVETSSPLGLNKGGFLIYERYESAPYEKFNRSNDEVSKFTFSNTLLGYGIQDYLTAYISVPYAIKEQDTLGKSKGLGDVNLILQLGFKFGERDGFKGWYLFDSDDVQGKEYTQTDWKFGLTTSLTIPSGAIDNKDNNGDTFGMGMQTGFAIPTFGVTGIMSKMLKAHWTFNMDTGFKVFSMSPDGKPGNEWRLNSALMYEAFENKGGFLSRFDIIGEANLLNLGKDIDGARLPDEATGGTIIYLSPGLRMSFFDKSSLGLLVKFPSIKNLNNEDQQQGAEGLEEFRAVATYSLPF